MLYTKRSFSVPASAGNATMCDSAGHAMADQRGKCIRCGEKVAEMCHVVAQAMEARNAHFITHKAAQRDHVECTGCGANFGR